MKKIARLLSILLCISLLISALPPEAGLFSRAEEIVDAVVPETTALPGNTEPDAAQTAEPTVAPTAEATAEPTIEPTAVPTVEPTITPTAAPTAEASAEPTIVPTAEPTNTPTAEPSTAPTAEPTAVPTEEPTPVPTAEPTIAPTPGINYGKNAGESPEFTSGYAVLLGSSVEVFVGEKEEDELRAELGLGVVYAVRRSAGEPDRLEIAYNPGPETGIETAWVSAQDIRPMNPALGGEVDLFRASCINDADVRCYNEDENLPLKKIACSYPAPASASLKRESAVIGVKDNGFRVEVVFSDGIEREVLYKSSNTRYATVDASGVVTGIRKGKAVITARTELGDLECEITVKTAPRSVSVKPKNGELAIGETAQLEVSFSSSSYGGTCRFVSSDPAVALVDENGVVTGVSKGMATISVYAYNLPKKPADAVITVLGPATAIAFPEEEISLCTGMEAQLSVHFLENERDTVSYTSDNQLVASVTENGLLHAHQAGTAVVTAVTPGGVSAACTVQVLPAPAEEDIVLLESACKLGLKESFNVLEMLSVAEGCHAEFSFESSKPKYASVDAAGNVTGLRRGSAAIRISTQNGITRDVTVEICSNPSSVSFAESKLVIPVDGSIATVLKFKSSGSYSRCRYFSSNPYVASVDEKGVVTGLRPGTATITADPEKGKSGSCTVQVMKLPEEISVEESVMNVGMYEKGRFVVGTHAPDTLCSFNYISRDSSVVHVNMATGEIITVAPGTAEVLVRANNGVTTVCTVNVLEAPQWLKPKDDSLKIMAGERYTGLEFSMNEGAASGITLKSSNSRYVKIEGNAIVGLRKGTATVTASTYNGVTASVKVTVCAAPKGITLNAKELSIGCGDQMLLEAGFTPAGSFSRVNYASSDPFVASVDPETGAVSAHAAGTAVITASPISGKAASCRVTVLPAPESISAAEENIRIGVGEADRKVRGVYPAGTLCSFSYASSDESIVRVDAVSGELTAIAKGSAEITITSHSGATALCSVEVADAPTELSLSRTTLQIMVGEEYAGLTGTVDGGAAAAITLKSSNTKNVKVENGVLIGLRKGNATITATTYNGIQATCKVSVCEAPRAIAFEASMLHLGCGETVKTGMKFKPSDAYSLISYTSDNPAVASVDAQTGVVTGLNAGTARITAAAMNGKSAACTVIVYPAPSSVHFTQEACSLSAGMETQLEAVLSNGSYGSYAFSSSNPAVARVDENGLVTAVSAGNTVIRVTTYNNFSAECHVTVTAAPAQLKYEFDQLTMLKGDVIPLPEPTAYDAEGNECSSSYSYTSSDRSVAVLDGEGNMKALRKGKSRITAKSYNGLKVYFVLNVSDEVVSIKLEPAQALLYTDGENYCETLQLSIRNMGSASASLSYTSSDPEVASVDENGLVTAVSAGTASITARAVNGSSAVSEITVLQLSGSISFASEVIELGEMESEQLVPQLEPGTTAVVSYESSNPKIASVDENGLVTAVKTGTAYITASMQNGKSAVVRVNVIHAPTSVTLGVARLRLAVGESITFAPALGSPADEFCDKLKYFSSADAVASVDENGSLTAAAPGETVVSVTTCNGLSDSCVVEVVADVQDAKLSFGAEHYSIICGDSAVLPVVLNKAAFERGYTITSSDSDLLSMEGLRASANSLRPGDASLTLSVNPDGENPVPGSVSCTVHVVSFAKVQLSAESIVLKKNETAVLQYSISPSDLIGTFSWELADEGVVSFDPESGLISAGEIAGETEILFRTFNSTASCRVKVLPGTKYRALIIGEYNKSGSDVDLVFARNNVTNMRNTLQMSDIGGECYELFYDVNNPSKNKIRNLITGSFAEATEEDVSLIYIVSHGYYSAAANGYYGYHFSIAPNYNKSNPSTYVTADELMNWMSGIKGQVVLVLDSCRSGGFIRDCAGKLAAAGNISVLTAQTYDKYASFYVGKTEATTVEFLTYSFCAGLGNDQLLGVLPKLPADRNNDGVVSVSEAFSYAQRETISQVQDKLPSYNGGKSGLFIPGGYFNGWSQNPQYYIADGMDDLPLFSRE